MLNTIVVMLERTTSVVRRVDEDALDFASELMFQRFEGKKIVTEDEAVIE
jgi:hypothetical protein